MDALESRRSLKAASFTESVIRDFTRLSDLHGAINLGQGFPDFPAPEEVKEAARRAIAGAVCVLDVGQRAAYEARGVVVGSTWRMSVFAALSSRITAEWKCDEL